MKSTTLSYTVSLLVVGLGLAFNSITQAQQIPEVAVVFNGSSTSGISTSYGTMSQSFLNGATETNWTIEFWVNNKQPQTDQVLACKDENWKYWMIKFPASGQVAFESSWPNTYYNMATTNGVIKLDTWQHVAIVGQGTLGSMYVDGALVYQANSLAGQISFNATLNGSVYAPFVLGFRDNATVADGAWFNGELANFRIWDIALSGLQVASLYSTQPATNAVGLRHWIPFNEGTGSTFTDIVGGLQGQLFGTGWTFPTNGLVAYYPFNGDANDESGNGNNGTIYGATLTTDRFGVQGKAMAFNGINQYIQAPHQAYLNFPGGDFTIAFWAVLNDLSLQYFIGKDMGQGVNDKWIVLYQDGQGSGRGINMLVFTSGSPGSNVLPGDVKPELGTWHHFLFRKRATTYTLDMDGLPVSSNTNGPPSLPSDNTAPLTIGRAEGGAYVNGKIDDIRIYDRALSDSEVQQLYLLEAPPILNIKKAVYVDSPNLKTGTNYQLQVSGDMNTWTNVGAVFTATNTSWRTTNYWDVDDWNSLFFRLQVSP